jgi:hypothetical protein
MKLFIILPFIFSHYFASAQISEGCIFYDCDTCFEIQPLPFNSEQDAINPFVFKNELIFSRKDDRSLKKNQRIGSGAWSSYPHYDFFSTKIDTLDAFNYEYLYSKTQKVIQKATKFHDISLNISSNQQTGLITRNNIFREDTVELKRNKVFIGQFNYPKLSLLYGLPFNSDEYSVEFPCFGRTDNIIFFASDMPGGFGGMDLYYSILEDEQWAPPINLGSAVNDEKNQSYPFFHQSTGRLYFSSDSHGSLGGFDVFYSKNIDGAYSMPVHLETPLNTSANETGFYINPKGDFGYFSSDRFGGEGGLDIYGFRYK